jgi:uncharacterized caspase-like protein
MLKHVITCVASVGALLLTLHGAAADKRVALVIGNSAYQHTAPLRNPSNDATDMAAKLRELGFDVIDGIDLTKAEMESRIRAFSDKLAGADVGLFYYAGHGLAVDGKNFLAPVDAALKSEADVDFETVELNLVLKQMERNSRLSLVFLDACRNNPLAANLATSSRSLAVARGLARVEKAVGMMIAFSTRPEDVALDGEGRNSPFTGALLRHISDEGESVNDVMIEVRNDVLKATDGKQVPWENSSLTGQFFFKPAATTTAADDSAASSANRGTAEGDCAAADRSGRRPPIAAGAARPVETEACGRDQERHAVGRPSGRSNIVPRWFAGQDLARRAGAGSQPRHRRGAGRRHAACPGAQHHQGGNRGGCGTRGRNARGHHATCGTASQRREPRAARHGYRHRAQIARLLPGPDQRHLGRPVAERAPALQRGGQARPAARRAAA